MSYFTDPQVEALVDAETVTVAALFKIELASATLSYSEVTTGTTDTTGQFWTGMRDGVVSFQDVQFNSNASAQKRTYRVAVGDNPNSLPLQMIGQESEYRWRPISQYLQFFAGSVPTGAPLVSHVGLMDRLKFSMTPTGAATLELTTETDFVRKNVSTSGLLTQSDQLSRHPDDKGLERIKLLALGQPVRWPDF